MQTVNLNDLVKINLTTSPTQAIAADLKTVLFVDPVHKGPIREFFSVEQLLNENAEGFEGVAGIAALTALQQRGVASVKIGRFSPDSEHIVKIKDDPRFDEGYFQSCWRLELASGLTEGSEVSFDIDWGTLRSVVHTVTQEEATDPSTLVSSVVGTINSQIGNNGFTAVVSSDGSVEIFSGSPYADKLYYLNNSYAFEIAPISGIANAINESSELFKVGAEFSVYNSWSYATPSAQVQVSSTVHTTLGALSDAIRDSLSTGDYDAVDYNAGLGEILIRWSAAFDAVASNIQPVSNTDVRFAAGETAEQALARLREEDDGWVALHVTTSTGGLDFIYNGEVVRQLSQHLEAIKEKILVVDILPFDSSFQPETNFENIKTLLEGQQFTAAFAAGAAGVEEQSEFPFSLVGAATAAFVLGQDPDLKSVSWAWQQLQLINPPKYPAHFFDENRDWLNVYGANRGIDITARGVSTSGYPMHAAVAALWFKFRSGERITQRIARYTELEGKFPYNNEGISVVGAVIDDLFRDGERIGHVLAGTGEINLPAVDQVTDEDYANSIYRYRAGFQVEGSIVDVILDAVASMTFNPADIGITEA